MARAAASTPRSSVANRSGSTHRAQRTPSDIVVEGLHGGPARGETELPAQPPVVHHAAEVEQPHLLRREVDEPRAAEQPAHRAYGRARHGNRHPACPADGLREQQHAVRGDVEDARYVLAGRPLEHGQPVLLVQQLHARVVSEHDGHGGQREVAGEHRVDARADEVREPQRGDRHVRAPSGEPAQVALDLDRVLGVPAGRQVLRRHRLVEQRGITWAGSVHRRGGLEHHAPYRRRLLARREQLHRADDVHLLHRHPAT